MTIVVDVGAKIVQAEYNGKKNAIFLAIVEAQPILPERNHAEVKGNALLSELQIKNERGRYSCWPCSFFQCELREFYGFYYFISEISFIRKIRISPAGYGPTAISLPNEMMKMLAHR